MCEIDPISLEKYCDVVERKKAQVQKNEDNRKKVFFKKNTGVSKLPDTRDNERLTKFFGITNNQ